MRLTPDLPPVWLAGFTGVAWLTGRVLPPLSLPAWPGWVGGAEHGAGAPDR